MEQVTYLLLKLLKDKILLISKADGTNFIVSSMLDLPCGQSRNKCTRQRN